MPNKMTFQRNLIGMEDLLLGLGKVTQTRGITQSEVTKISASIFPYDDTKTLKEKIDSLEPVQYVDGAGIPVYIATPHSPTDLNLIDVIWVKDVSGTERHVYYYDQLMFKYDTVNGDLLLDPAVFGPTMTIVDAKILAGDNATLAAATALINAEVTNRNNAITAVTTAYKAADTAIIANLALGTASKEDVGTNPGDVVQLNNDGKLPAVDGSLLTNLPVAAAPTGSMVQRTFDEYNSVANVTVGFARTGAPPLATQGTLLMQRSFVPKAIGNKLIIRAKASAFHFNKASSVLGLFINGTFQKGDYAASHQNAATHPGKLYIEFEYTTVSLDPIDIMVRGGPAAASGGPVKFNDSSWGLTGIGATMVVEEVKG